jgi:NAD(P)-dependent dehydrogenase (short-subunit alcohol dehydrogenase family)
MKQRTILITGSNRGIGNATGLELCKLGHTVLFTARSLSSLDATKQICTDQGYKAEYYELDVSKLSSIQKLYKDIAKRHQHIDTLINNAGILIDRDYPLQAVDDKISAMPLDKLETTIQTNLVGPIMMIQTFTSMLKKSSSGIIVNFSSTLGSLTDMGSGMPSYRISKCALNAVTRICATELEGIKVNSIHPGWVQTDMGGKQASLTIAESVPGVVWAATLPKDGPTGKFFFNQKEIDW